MCASYKDKSRDTDFDQHASKIFDAIKEIQPEYAEKRAIWELFQNALDIVEEKGIIKITKTEKGFKFEHNGRPFNDGNLTGLIKQSSNGKTYGSNKNGAGQYGTGFLSTHVYGKSIYINASLTTDAGKIKLLKDFHIDRDAKDPIALNKKIQKQDELAENICDKDGNEIKEHFEFTSFEYVQSEESKKYIENMFNYIPTMLPYIFAFNNKLHEVQIFNRNTLIYKRNEIYDYELDISINGSSFKFSFLSDNESDIKIVMPQSNLFFKEVPKLFLFYPLMETVDLGINYLIHALEFKPNKERDYLFLIPSNEELEKDVKANKLLLNRAFELIIKKIKEDTSLDFLAVINIVFIENENPYLKEKKAEIINSVKDLNRIKVKENPIPLTSIFYLHNDILSLGENDLETIFPLIAEFYDLPDFKEYIYLSQKVNNWHIGLNNIGLEDIPEEKKALTEILNSLILINYEDILDKIIQKTGGYFTKITNQTSYIAFLKTISTDTELISNRRAIPNIHDEFKLQKELKRWDKIEQPLITTMDLINKDVSMFYLHPDFYFFDNITIYTRTHFIDDLNKFNTNIIDLLGKNELEKLNLSSVKKYYSTFESLIFFISLNKITNTNQKYIEFFKSVFKIPQNSELIDNPTVNLNYDLSFKLLARLYIKYISLKGNKYISDLIPKLKIFVDILYENSELNKNLLDKLACFPNQLYELRPQYELKLDHINDEDFKDEYLKITNKNARRDLLLSDFDKYISHSIILNGSELGSEMESTLNSNKIFIPINDNNKNILPTLLNLIQHISKPNSKWAEWLHKINEVKEEILMYKFQDEKTRLSLFNILSEKEDKINLLGELAKISDLQSLINAGRLKQKEDERKEKHIKYIKSIGLKIQDLIQNQINSQLVSTFKIVESKEDEKLATIEEQSGQDFIIYKSGNPIFYIEVKSRWDSEGIVALSKRQVERCAQNEGKYAVITVNVANYKSDNKNVVEEDISFDQLSNYVHVNLDLSENFELLIKENMEFEKLTENTKLIEFRGHIPQDRIKNKGIDFQKFIEELKILLLN